MEEEALTEDEIAFQFKALRSGKGLAPFAAISKLAKASRTQPEVRVQLVDDLPNVVETLRCAFGQYPGVVDAALRCIGNACADSLAGRNAITTIGFDWANQALKSDDRKLHDLVGHVIFNICKDHEASQRECYKQKVHYHFWQVWPKDSEGWDNALEAVGWISGHKPELEEHLSEPMPGRALKGLLLHRPKLRTVDDLTDVMTANETILQFVRDPIVQDQIAQEGLLLEVLNIVSTYENRPQLPDISDTDDELQLLKAQCVHFVNSVSDIAARPGFAKYYGLERGFISGRNGSVLACIETVVFDQVKIAHPTAKRNLNSNGIAPSSGDVFIAKCHIIGNLLWRLPPERFASWADEGMLRGFELHEHLLGIIALEHPDDLSSEALHVIAYVLIQLSRPSVLAREVIGGNMYAEDAMTRMCHHDETAIRKESIRLLRALGKDCPANQNKFADLLREAMRSVTTNGTS